MLPQIPLRLSAICWALSLLCQVSCVVTGMGEEPNSQPPRKNPEQQAILSQLRGGVPLHFVPAIRAIEVALAEGANVTARGSLRALFRRNPSGPTLELARAFERILDGREHVSWLQTSLVAREDPELVASFRLELVLANTGPQQFFYRPGGALLWVMQTAIGPNGADQRGSRRDPVPVPEEISIGPGEEVRLEVAQLALNPPPGVLAFSSRLRLELLPGEFRTPQGRYLPAQAISQPRLELVRLAGELPNSAIEPEALAEYVKQGSLFQPAVLERAVRIEPERRDEALDLLTPLLANLTMQDVKLLVPALRWLAGTSQPGGDPMAWRRYMQRRKQRREQPESNPKSSLRLPRS